MADVSAELGCHGYTLIGLCADESASLVSALTGFEQVLRTTASQGASQAGASQIAAHRERAQLRHVPCGGPKASAVEQPDAEAARKVAAEAVCDILARPAQAALSTLLPTEVDGNGLLDVFWYPGLDGWAALGRSGEPPPPCPAHEDSGLITVLFDNCSALEGLAAPTETHQILPSKQQEAGHCQTEPCVRPFSQFSTQMAAGNSYIWMAGRVFSSLAAPLRR
jgi:hypothetical protein